MPLDKCVDGGGVHYRFVTVENAEKYYIYAGVFGDETCTDYWGAFMYFGGPKCEGRVRFEKESKLVQPGLITYSVMTADCPQDRSLDNVYYYTTSIPLGTCIQIDGQNSAILNDCYEKGGFIFGNYNRYNNRNCMGKPTEKNELSVISNTQCSSDGYGGSMWDACVKPKK